MAFDLLPEEIAGVVPATHWNNIRLDGETGNGECLVLNDSAGLKTGIKLIFTAGGNLHDANTKPVNPLEKLYHSWLTVPYAGYPPKDARGTAYLADIPFSTYDIYLYVYTVGGSSDTCVYQGTENGTIGSNKSPYVGDCPDSSGSYKEGGNYVKFTGLTGSTQFFVLSNVTNTEGNLNTEFAGMEIVNTSESSAEPAQSKKP